MVQETIKQVNELADKKVALLNDDVKKYFLLSVLAGVYVGLGIMLIYSIGAPLWAVGSPALKTLMGASFALALSLVIFAGSELFTGNTMVMMIAGLSKRVAWINVFRIWVVSYLGNLAGSLALAWALVQTGLINKSPLNEFVLTATADKMAIPIKDLFFLGILCNILVCLAVWTSIRAKEDTAKLILIALCLFGFIGAGFEHSIANMTLLGMGIFTPHDPNMISWLGYARNLIPVTVGNMIGGAICIGTVYWYVAKDSVVKELKVHKAA